MPDAQTTADKLDGLVHLDTQAAPHGVDLTVTAVFRLTGAGSLDFGGSEFEEAARERLEPEKAQPDDDYGWWELRAGTYVVRYNESVSEAGVLLVTPHRRLLQAGAHHAAFQVQEPTDQLEAVLIVPERGVRIKENARISRLAILES